MVNVGFLDTSRYRYLLRTKIAKIINKHARILSYITLCILAVLYITVFVFIITNGLYLKFLTRMVSVFFTFCGVAVGASIVRRIKSVVLPEPEYASYCSEALYKPYIIPKEQVKVDKRVTGSKEVDEELNLVIEHVINDFVLSWYQQISENDEFPFEVRQIIQSILIKLSSVMKELDVHELISGPFSHAVLSQVSLYRRALGRAKTTVKNRSKLSTKEKDELYFDKLETYFFELERSHKFVLDPASESKYLSQMCELLLFAIVKEETFENPEVRTFLKEILAKSVLLPMINSLSDPDYINQTICSQLPDLPKSYSKVLAFIRTCSDPGLLLHLLNSYEQQKRMVDNLLKNMQSEEATSGFSRNWRLSQRSSTRRRNTADNNNNVNEENSFRTENNFTLFSGRFSMRSNGSDSPNIRKKNSKEASFTTADDSNINSISDNNLDSDSLLITTSPPILKKPTIIYNTKTESTMKSQSRHTQPTQQTQPPQSVQLVHPIPPAQSVQSAPSAPSAQSVQQAQQSKQSSQALTVPQSPSQQLQQQHGQKQQQNNTKGSHQILNVNSKADTSHIKITKDTSSPSIRQVQLQPSVPYVGNSFLNVENEVNNTASSALPNYSRSSLRSELNRIRVIKRHIRYRCLKMVKDEAVPRDHEYVVQILGPEPEGNEKNELDSAKKSKVTTSISQSSVQSNISDIDNTSDINNNNNNNKNKNSNMTKGLSSGSIVSSSSFVDINIDIAASALEYFKSTKIDGNSIFFIDILSYDVSLCLTVDYFGSFEDPSALNTLRFWMVADTFRNLGQDINISSAEINDDAILIADEFLREKKTGLSKNEIEEIDKNLNAEPSLRCFEKAQESAYIYLTENFFDEFRSSKGGKICFDSDLHIESERKRTKSPIHPQLLWEYKNIMKNSLSEPSLSIIPPPPPPPPPSLVEKAALDNVSGKGTSSLLINAPSETETDNIKMSASPSRSDLIEEQKRIVKEEKKRVRGNSSSEVTWKATIIDKEIHYDKKIEPTVFYVLQITMTDNVGDICWKIIRRYSDFNDFHMRLLALNVNVPPFPGKKAFGNMRASFLASRLTALNEYLQELLAMLYVLQDHAIEGLIGSFLSYGMYTQEYSDVAKKMFSVRSAFSGLIPFRKKTAETNFSLPKPLRSLAGIGERPYLKDVALKKSDVEDIDLDSVQVRIILAICDEVFDFTAQKNSVLRKRFVLMARHIVEKYYGDFVKMVIAQSVDSILLSSEQIKSYITMFRNSFWPNGKFATAALLRTDEEKLNTRHEAHIKLMSSITDESKRLIGGENCRAGANRIFKLLQNRSMNKRLLYLFLESFIAHAFPHLNFEENIACISEGVTPTSITHYTPK